MTEAGWTREKPTVAGWYWWRRDQHALPGVAIVCSDLSGYYMNRTGYNSTFDHVDDVIGEWLGPLTPDSYQQGRVAGLREAVPLACKYCNDRTKWTPMSNSGYHVCNMPEPGFVRCQAIKIHAALAQQAQGEKGVGDGN